MGRSQFRWWAVAGAGSLLAALALVAAQAQKPKESAPELPSVPSTGPRIPLPPTRLPATPSTVIPFSGIGFLSPDSPPQLAPRLTGPPPTGAPAASLIDVRLELITGLCLEGQVAATSLHGIARFGELAIPLNTVRGLRLHESKPDGGEVDSKLPEGPRATVILDNEDSLTLVLRAPQIQVKTSWGTAIVDLPHVRSLVVTGD